ncbi:hypothetical protein TM102_64710 [Bradyrhizobium sp. TM102]|nr:hypothetical protein TM102_64710 [Bradyrhizobium sp. TM102]
MLAIDHQKTIPSLLVQEELRNWDAKYERLDELGCPHLIPNKVTLKSWYSNRARLYEIEERRDIEIVWSRRNVVFVDL